jgi:CheY-like chemotaxis protein
MATLKNIFLAEDDSDDLFFFQRALAEIPHPTILTRAKDGVELIDILTDLVMLPDIIFLDINMPRKNGFQCLLEIKANPKFAKVPVIAFSTSDGNEIIRSMFNSGASAYIIKPNEFSKWSTVIHKALSIDWMEKRSFTDMDSFIIKA